jgi:sec-independent protein translocase protein TatA
MGPTELLIIALVILLLFGGSKLPTLFRSLGRAKSEFEAGAQEGHASSAAGAPAVPPVIAPPAVTAPPPVVAPPGVVTPPPATQAPPATPAAPTSEVPAPEV